MRTGKHLSGLRDQLTSTMRSLSGQALRQIADNVVMRMDDQIYDSAELEAACVFARTRVRLTIQRLPKRGRRHAVRP